MSTVLTVPLEYRRRGRGADGDEPNTIVVLGSKIVRRIGVEGALEALNIQQQQKVTTHDNH